MKLEVLTAATDSDLISLATAQLELKIESQTEVEGLEDLIASASAICAKWCRRPEGFGEEEVRQTERITRDRSAILLARDLQVVIDTVTVDGTELAADEYEIERGSMLYRLDSSDNRTPWIEGSKVVIVYTAGYDLATSVPDDLKQACIVVLGQMVAGRGRDPTLRSESVDGVMADSYLDPTSATGGLPILAAGYLETWRREGG